MARKPREKKKPAPEVGNKVSLTEDEQQALFFYHLNRIRKARETVKERRDDEKALLKTAKVDGFTKLDFDYAMGLENSDEERLLARRTQENRIARWLQHPVGSQPDMFEDANRKAADADKIYEEGKIAGMTNIPMRPPYGVASPEGQRWIEGWHAGQHAVFNIKKTIQKKQDDAAFDAPEATGDALAGLPEGEAAE